MAIYGLFLCSLQVRILYVRNLLVTTKEKELEDIFNAASDNGVEKVKILNDFAFVHFVSREQAQKAMDALQGMSLQGLWHRKVTFVMYLN